MLCAYISAIQCTCIVFTCDVCKYICGTIVYLSKANRFLFFWAGSCFASPGAGIPQDRGKVWKSERAGVVSSNSRPFEWEGFDYLYYSQNMPPLPLPLLVPTSLDMGSITFGRKRRNNEGKLTTCHSLTKFSIDISGANNNCRFSIILIGFSKWTKPIKRLYTQYID